MIIFLTLCYCAFLFIMVKIGVIKLNSFWKASPLIWMTLLLVFLFIPMNWGAPAGPVMLYQNVVSITPNVSGEVVEVLAIANQPMNTPASKNINTLQVPRGFDVADDEIIKRLSAGDLVITSDIPLAAEVIEKGGHALSPRGEMHTKENIGARLNMRDFLDTMRSSGVEMGGGPAAFSQRDKQTFANELDRFLTRFA